MNAEVQNTLTRPSLSGNTLPRTSALIKSMRIHHWVKNLLLFAPLLAAHRFSDNHLWFLNGIAFLAFSLSASTAYLFNDILDIPSDKIHPTKKLRPIASGELTIPGAGIFLIVLLSLTSILGTFVSTSFVLLNFLYFLFSVAYSLYFKRVMGVDVVFLASLYVLRVISGGVATQTPLTHWFLSFAMFLFCSLAFLKRFSELKLMQIFGESSARGRDYRIEDMQPIQMLGVATGSLAVFVLALYLNNSETHRLYSHPERLWALCPLLLSWIARLWITANRGEIHEDPVVFAITDKINYFLLSVCALTLFWAST